MTYTTSKWNFTPTTQDDIVTVIGKDGLLDEYNNGAKLRKNNYRAAQAITLTGANIPVELHTPFDGANLPVTITITTTTTMPVVVPLSQSQDYYTVGDFVNRINGAINAHGVYCLLEPLNINTMSSNTTGIVFYSNISPFTISTALIIGNNIVGTPANIPNQLLGVADLTTSTTPVGGNDDGYWTLVLPFTISCLNNTTNTVYVGTNSHITFGSGWSNTIAGISDPGTPPLSKILINAGDHACQQLHYGAEGTAPNRTFRIVFEGTDNWDGTSASGGPDLNWEVVFYENNTDIDIQTGIMSTTAGQFGLYSASAFIGGFPSTASTGTRITTTVTPIMGSIFTNGHISNIATSEVSLPIRSSWEILGETNNYTVSDRRGSPDGIRTPTNSIIPSYTLEKIGTSDIKYRVEQPAWPRTGHPLTPKIDLQEIVNLKWALGYEILSANSNDVFGNEPAVLLSMIKMSPGKSVIDLNDPQFRPNWFATKEGNMVSGYIALSQYGTPNATTPSYQFPVEFPRNRPSHIINETFGSGLAYANVLAFNFSSNTYTVCAIPNTDAMLGGNLSNIPISQGQKLVWYIPMGGTKNIWSADFSASIKGFVPEYGVYNTTGLSNDVRYHLGYQPDAQVGSNILNIYTECQLGSPTYRIINNDTIVSDNNGDLHSPYTFTTTKIAGSGAGVETIIYFDVIGPGTLHIQYSTTGSTPYDWIRADEIVDVIGGTSMGAMLDFTPGNASGTISRTFTNDDPHRIELHSYKYFTTGSRTTTWSNVYFRPNVVYPPQQLIYIDRDTYTIKNTTPYPYDVTTIQGLIRAINGIAGSATVNSADHIVDVGWSFGGKITFQSIGKHQISLSDFSSYGYTTTDLVSTLLNINVPCDIEIYNNINNASPDPNPNSLGCSKGIAATIPLIPIG
jgi:hypothetical protein